MIETVDSGNRITAIRDGMANLIGKLPLVRHAVWRVLRGGSAVFMFHRVLPPGAQTYDPEMVTSTDAFADFLDWLCQSYQVLPLDELVVRRGETRNANRPLCAITFDDGWMDNYTHAFPLLRQRRLPATIFLPVRLIGTKEHFWQEWLWLCLKDLPPERQRQLIQNAARHVPWFPTGAESCHSLDGLRWFLRKRPTREAEDFAHALMGSAGVSTDTSSRAFLNWGEVRQMQGMDVSFGSHGLNHTLLTHIDEDAAAVEIRQSRDELTGHLAGRKTSGFAYPWGAASSTTQDTVRQSGYDFAFTTLPGLVNARADRWMLPRIFVSDSVLRSGPLPFAPGKTQLWCAKSALRPMKQKPSKNGKRIKVAFVIDTISEWEGGTERQLQALIQSLDRTHFEPELCFLLPSPELPKESLPCTTRWVCPEPPTLRISIISRFVRLTRLLSEMRPQVVQTFFNEGIFAGILAARLSGVPRVVGSARNAGYWKNLRHRIAFRSVAKLAHRWQCNSRTLWEYVRTAEGVSPDRIEILPNALDLSKFVPAEAEERLALRRKLGLSESGPIFVMVAALTQVKDHVTLLQAAQIVQAELPSAEFLIVGDGPLHADLEQKAGRLGVSHTVRFCGRQADVRPYLAAADFGVLTSRSEGSSNSVLEYMAMGLPSVVSNIPANRELVSGLLFTAGDAGDLSHRLLQVARDPALGAKLRFEYLRTASEFGMDKFVARAQAFYTRLASEMN